jgi:hypothetical protein
MSWAGQDIAVQHDHRAVRAAAQSGRGVPDRPAGAERFRLVDVGDLQPERGTVPEALGKHAGPVGGGQHHVGDAGRGRLGELVGEERHARRGQQGLGRPDGERSQPGALAADEQDRLKRLAAGGHFWLA